MNHWPEGTGTYSPFLRSHCRGNLGDGATATTCAVLRKPISQKCRSALVNQTTCRGQTNVPKQNMYHPCLMLDGCHIHVGNIKHATAGFCKSSMSMLRLLSLRNEDTEELRLQRAHLPSEGSLFRCCNQSWSPSLSELVRQSRDVLHEAEVLRSLQRFTQAKLRVTCSIGGHALPHVAELRPTKKEAPGKTTSKLDFSI